ncbi:MAG: DUF692 domain-containing protein [Alphaproteobacteria bacterium]|nr:DUF692 domain-containing protein [Alphaproteobacteria bacterium]MBL6938291.1 DUF692 domain-containing protein [Alphaproteobacteria bacterium]MBL7097347.1 DUF692 domain-containing protein [Alphaproteobacteria bacterium]
MRSQQPHARDPVAPISARAGIGVKPVHYRELLASVRPLGFVEVHAENYMGAGGPPHAYLEAITERYPLSLHGVGLSLGGAEPLDPVHLRAWRRLVDRYQPALVSEHIAWSRFGECRFHDLLPIPYTDESLTLFAAHVEQFQNTIGRQILVENPSAYLGFATSDIPEADFIAELVRRTGCGVLLDINNAYVSAANGGEGATALLRGIPADTVGEIHLAGHSVQRADELELYIDDHGSPVGSAVWLLYAEAIARFGAKPTLVEWDTDVPSLGTLCREAERANVIARKALSHAAA